MYIDIILIVIVIIALTMYFKHFSAFVFSVAIVDILLRILTFIKNNIGLKELIKNSKLDEIVFGKLINVNISYDKLDTLEYLVTKTNSKIITKEFGEDVSCEIEVSNDNLELFEKYNYEIKKDITM